jgi:predicted phosphatase
MKLVAFTSVDTDRTCYVNPEQICFVDSEQPEVTRIWLNSGQLLLVKDPIDLARDRLARPEEVRF